MIKVCTKCNIEKLIQEFHKDVTKKDGYHQHCKSCRKIANKKHYDLTTDYQKQRKVIYYNNNKQKISNRISIYQLKNKDHLKMKQKIYKSNKYNTDSNYKLTKLLRDRLRLALKTNTKSKSTMKLLGCTINELKIHLQQTAINNGYLDFDINNYSGKKYHIDHIKPCSSFDLSKPEEQQICFHWSNLQILTSEANLKKSDKLMSTE